jgi:hypothetical protein
MAEMAASIAHEVNQPLTAVVTHAYAGREWLSAEPPNLVKASATTDKIVQESTRAGAVVSRVRALFRKEVVVRESADVNQVIRDLVPGTRRGNPARSIHNTGVSRWLASFGGRSDPVPNLEAASMLLFFRPPNELSFSSVCAYSSGMQA